VLLSELAGQISDLNRAARLPSDQTSYLKPPTRDKSPGSCSIHQIPTSSGGATFDKR
jgi:hypothetical protein